MNDLPPDFEDIAHIETLSVAVTQLRLERDALDYTNIAGMSVDQRIAFGMRIAVNEAKFMRAKNELRLAQEAFASKIKGEQG
jgi:hypothetical protein